MAYPVDLPGGDPVITIVFIFFRSTTFSGASSLASSTFPWCTSSSPRPSGGPSRRSHCCSTVMMRLQTARWSWRRRAESRLFRSCGRSCRVRSLATRVDIYSDVSLSLQHNSKSESSIRGLLVLYNVLQTLGPISLPHSKISSPASRDGFGAHRHRAAPMAAVILLTQPARLQYNPRGAQAARC